MGNSSSGGLGCCSLRVSIILFQPFDKHAKDRQADSDLRSWLFVVNFGYSWGPCAWVIIAEIWPLSNRAYGIALGASSNWMCNFIVGQVTPDMLQSLKYGTFIFFGLMTFGGGLFIWSYVPETKRLTLEEIDTLFGSVGVAENVCQALYFLDWVTAYGSNCTSRRQGA